MELKGHLTDSNYFSFFLKKGTKYGQATRLQEAPLFLYDSRFKTRHNNSNHSKEGTSKNLIFSCPVAHCHRPIIIMSIKEDFGVDSYMI